MRMYQFSVSTTVKFKIVSFLNIYSIFYSVVTVKRRYTVTGVLLFCIVYTIYAVHLNL